MRLQKSGPDFNFDIKSLVAIAPVDGQYRPADKPTPLTNVNYFLIHGSHDGDLSTFSGLTQYELVRFTDGQPWFKAAMWVYRANQPRTKVGRLMPAKGQALFVHKVWLTERRFGPVYLALAHVQTAAGYEQWAIVSDEPTDLQTLTEYGFRFDIEENFLDDKSAGFQLESSEIQQVEALAPLLLILAVAWS